MLNQQSTFLVVLLLLLHHSAAQIDLGKWTLQLPDDTSVSGSKLSAGYKSADFYPASNGDIVMIVDPPGCKTTPNSKHCRTELSEASPSSWDPKGPTNKLSATLTVVEADNSQHGTVIGQIHIVEKVSVRPVCELYYNSGGVLSFGVEQTRKGGNEVVQPLKAEKIPLKTQFSYTISYAGGKLSVSINGGAEQVFSTYQLDSPPSYFKAGNYNQGETKSEVHFKSIQVEH
jgi:hypothetical protein